MENSGDILLYKILVKYQIQKPSRNQKFIIMIILKFLCLREVLKPQIVNEWYEMADTTLKVHMSESQQFFHMESQITILEKVCDISYGTGDDGTNST